jgi:5'-nucleotidase
MRLVVIQEVPKLHILLTNDDGIMSPGIAILAETLSSEHDVIVVAPDVERSATGHAITIRTPLWAKEVKLGRRSLGYAINGTPADCVKLGLLAISKRHIDLVVSGINRGPNLGTDILYSGTVSGALEGAIMGKPSIAISCANWNDPLYESSAEFLLDFLKTYDTRSMPDMTALNINVPAVPPDEIRGWQVTRQSRRRYKDYFEERKDPFGESYYWMFGDIVEDDPGSDSDYSAIREGYVSITPITAMMNVPGYAAELRRLLEGVRR